MAALTTETLTELNGRVAVDRETAEDVARDFLVERGPARGRDVRVTDRGARPAGRAPRRTGGRRRCDRPPRGVGSGRAGRRARPGTTRGRSRRSAATSHPMTRCRSGSAVRSNGRVVSLHSSRTPSRRVAQYSSEQPGTARKYSHRSTGSTRRRNTRWVVGAVCSVPWPGSSASSRAGRAGREVTALLADRGPVVAHPPPVDRLDEGVEPGWTSASVRAGWSS